MISSTLRPSRAAPTELTPSCWPKIQSATVVPSAPAVIFSFKLSGPSFLSSSLQPQRSVCQPMPWDDAGPSARQDMQYVTRSRKASSNETHVHQHT